MKIASYNIFEGAKDSIPQLEEFAQREELDVLCLQEANDWLEGTPSQLDKFVALTGLVHVVSGGNRRFKIITLSRLPFSSTYVHSGGLWHGAVRTGIDTGSGTLDIWNTHLNPHDEDSRVLEAGYIAGNIDTNKQSLVVGDFNSLSQADAYPESLARSLSIKGITKFGTGKNRYDVTQIMANDGLLDLADLFNARANTVPTPVNKDKNHADLLRLDYMFGSESLARRVLDIDVPKDDLTNRISDHYPLVLTLDDKE